MTLPQALAKAQAQFPAIEFDSEAQLGGGRRYRYASLHAVLKAVKPALNALGIFVFQSCTETIMYGADEKPYLGVKCVTRFYLGEEVLEEVCEKRIDAATMHAFGSAQTYLKRYMLCSMLSVVGEEDDDANSISTPRGTVPRTPAQRSGTASGGRAAAPATPQPAGELTTEGRVTDHKFGTTKAGREWLIATLVDLSSGEAVKVGTFSRSYIDALRKTSGTDQVWKVTHAPGKKDDTRDVVKVVAVNEAGEALLEGIPF